MNTSQRSPNTQRGSYGALRAKYERVSKRSVGFLGCGGSSRGGAEVRGCWDGLPGGCQSGNNNDGLLVAGVKTGTREKRLNKLRPKVKL